MTRYNGTTDALEIVNFGGAYGYEREKIKKKWMMCLDEIEFENIKFSAISKYHEYLKYFYGDYMKLPPKNKRWNRHQILEVEF